MLLLLFFYFSNYLYLGLSNNIATPPALDIHFSLGGT